MFPSLSPLGSIFLTVFSLSIVPVARAFTSCGLTLPVTDAQLDQLRAPPDGQVLQAIHQGRGIITYHCDDVPETHVINVNLYDVTNIPKEPLRGGSIAAFGKIVRQGSITHMVVNSANGQKIFGGYKASEVKPPSARELPWQAYWDQYKPMSIYQVNTIGGYHVCKRGQGLVTLPVKAEFWLYGDPSVAGITRKIAAKDICSYMAEKDSASAGF